MNWIINGMIYLGAALMVYNIWGFLQFTKQIQQQESVSKERTFLYIPIVLLVFFLIGYLMVALFGKPTLIIAGILFGGRHVAGQRPKRDYRLRGSRKA